MAPEFVGNGSQDGARQAGSLSESDKMVVDPLGSVQEQEKDRQFVTALARGLELLRCFTPRENVLGNQDLARKTGLPKPTVTRLTHTLMRLGYLR